MITPDDPNWPREPHPHTGEPFVECVKYSRRRENQTVRWGPPERPRQIATWWDDDDVQHVRKLSDEEYAAALAAYESSYAEWQRTGGIAVSAGPMTEEACFRCASGAWAEYVGDGSGRWSCIEWGSR